MAEGDPRDIEGLQPDTANLYREEVVTNLRAATIRCLTPVDVTGAPDPSRPSQFIGETTLLTQMGPLPVQAPIEADSLEDAFAQFPEAVKVAVERLSERAQEMRREEAGRIVVPGGGLPAGGMPPGLGAAPGGKIILD